MNKSEELDQFFTKKPLAKELFEATSEILKEIDYEFDCWLEPSAGDGSFFYLLPENARLGIDIDKQIDDPNFVEKDFLSIDIEDFCGLRYTAIGNPPFGNRSSLAIKFFNHCAKMCGVIAFILPKTFKKCSIINRLNEHFHLIHQQDLPDNAFEINGIDKSVPCVFQIWNKRKEKRHIIKMAMYYPDIEFLTANRITEATLIFRRVGSSAGTFKNLESGKKLWSPNFYYIKCSEDVSRILQSITVWAAKYNTAGFPSISKGDLIEAYQQVKLTIS